jgi:carotenoid cleavage dioxygenase
MSLTDANRYVAGNLGPVTEEITATDLQVIGTLPEQLDGRYLRNGPNPIGPIDPATHHWFVGEGMVHGIRLRGGKAEWYRNRWVRAGEVPAKLGEPPRPHQLGADRPTGSANTNVIGHAGRTFAIVEAGSTPVELTDELETVGPTDFGGTLPWGFSAHPKLDPATGSLHVAAYFWGWGNQMQYLVVGPDGTVTTVQDVPLLGAGSPMVHDVSITESRVVLYDLPCIFDLDAAMGGSKLPYRWHPENGTRLGVLPLGSGDVSWVELPEPCYVYHPLNAHDLADGRIQLDVVVHPSTFDRDVHGPDEGSPTLQRWIVDPVAGRVTTELRDDRGQEFPRVDERMVGRAARYGYCVKFAAGIEHGGLTRHDLVTGESLTYEHGPGRSTMETVFVPAAPDAGETDGWLMSVVHDENTGHGELVVLDAADFGAPPVARVMIPARVPYGFHGNWVPTRHS